MQEKALDRETKSLSEGERERVMTKKVALDGILDFFYI